MIPSCFRDSTARILGIADGLGVAGDQIATGRMSVLKHRKRDKHGNRKGFSQFSLRRKVSIELRDLNRFEDFLTGLLEDGDLDVRLVWRASAADSVRHELQLKAVRDARRKADAMAEFLGARVGAPLIISEWPIITDSVEVDRLSREAGFSLQLKPERIRVTDKAYIRFELIVDEVVSTAGLP